jgi:hypothetical protein
MGLEEGFEFGRVELRPEDLSEEARAIDDVGPEFSIDGLDVGDRAPEGEEGCDDGAGGCAGDEIKIVRQHETVLSALDGAPPEHAFDMFEDPEGEHAADAAAIEGEDTLRPV